jgi:Spirocyclase AveC-like
MVTKADAQVRATLDQIEARPVRPVKWFALVGAAVLVLQVFAWVRWGLSGHMKPAPVFANDGMPRWMLINLQIMQVVNVVASIVIIYWFVIRPLIRERRLSFDGMLVLTWIQLWLLQDPIENWTQNNFAYNSHFANRGSWTSSIPGWVAPDSYKMGEPFLFGLGAYVGGMFLPMLLCCWFMRKVKQRYPRIGVAGLIGVAIAFMTVFLFVLETIWVRTGMYSYLAVVNKLSLWSGHYYQYPLYSCLSWGVFWGLMVSLRYFRNDKGESVAERGVDAVKATPKQRQVLRLLAIIGAANILYAAFYNLPMNVFAPHVDAVPQDVLNRPYLTSGLCGFGAERACPGPAIPVFRQDSAIVTPQGEMVAPPGGVPIQVPAK